MQQLPVEHKKFSLLCRNFTYRPLLIQQPILYFHMIPKHYFRHTWIVLNFLYLLHKTWVHDISMNIELPFCYVQEKFLLLVGHMYQKMKVLPYILWQSSRSHTQFLVLHARMVYIACIHIVSGHIKVITQYSSHLSIPWGSKTVLWK